jgi:hypothetical protein
MAQDVDLGAPTSGERKEEEGEGMMAFNLGEMVKERVTGFTGMVTGIAYYLGESTSIRIQPRTIHNGSPIDARWFSEERTVAIGEGFTVEIHPFFKRKEKE